MDCLFIDLSPYYTDPIEEEFEVFLEEQYYFIPSASNVKGGDDKKPFEAVEDAADAEIKRLSAIKKSATRALLHPFDFQC